MKPYVKKYLSHFGYTPECFIPCEVCKGKAVDIHHIERRGMGGSILKDKIENLMALCRDCHVEYGDKKQHMQYLKDVHEKIMLVSKK